MESQKTITFENAAIRFTGMLRGIDDLGHHAYEIHFAKREAPLYGEWYPRFLEDHRSFEAIIANFGFGDRHNLGNTNRCARATILESERDIAVRLIYALFSDEEARTSYPFSAGGKFTQSVIFNNDWVRLTL